LTLRQTRSAKGPDAFATPARLLFRFLVGEAAESALDLAFQHPRPGVARGQILEPNPAHAAPPLGPEEGLEVLFTPSAGKAASESATPAGPWLAAAPGETVSIKAGEMSVRWRPGRAVVSAPTRLAVPALRAVVDFAYYDAALRTVEAAILNNWTAVEADAPLTSAVSDQEFKSAGQIDARMRDVIALRLQFARIEPRVLCPDPNLPEAAYALGEALREAAHCESRAEAADGQIESQEYVYELSSQRRGDHHHARKGYLIEIVIVALLAAELVLGVIYAVQKI
jgi:hypothetical protein